MSFCWSPSRTRKVPLVAPRSVRKAQSPSQWSLACIDDMTLVALVRNLGLAGSSADESDLDPRPRMRGPAASLPNCLTASPGEVEGSDRMRYMVVWRALEAVMSSWCRLEMRMARWGSDAWEGSRRRGARARAEGSGAR